jgi:hypothetical protein
MKKDVVMLTDRGWGDIDEMARKAIAENWFPESAEKGTLAYVKARIRALAMQKNKETGLPVLGSIEVPNEEGKRAQRFYKQLPLFGVEDYSSVINYHRQKANHHGEMVKAYAQDCKKRFGAKIIQFFTGTDDVSSRS